MATTPSHAVQGGLIMFYVLKLIWFVIGPVLGFILTPLAPIIATCLITLAAVASALPDIIGELEPEDPGDEYKKWSWYTVMHTKAAAWAADHLQYVFTIFIVIHVWEDRFFHDLGTGKWTKMAYVYEVVIDVGLLIIIVFLVNP